MRPTTRRCGKAVSPNQVPRDLYGGRETASQDTGVHARTSVKGHTHAGGGGARESNLLVGERQ